MPFTARLAARFARSRLTARSAGIVFVAGAFLLTIFVTLQSLALSGPQMVERDLGRFGASVGYGTIVAAPGDDRVTPTLLRAARRAGATDAMIFLSATNVQLFAGRARAPREVGFHEAEWTTRPFPERYRLLSGRWPERPFEVVVTEPADLGVTRGAEVAAFGGSGRFRVVGTVDDRYARTAALLAAPGTWAGLEPDLTARFPVLRAQPVLFWSGNAEERVVSAFAAVAAARGGTEATPDTVAASLTARAQLAARRGQSWLDRTPAAYTVPSLLLPFAAAWLAFGLNSRRFNRNVHVLKSLGVSRATAAASLSLATASWCVAAALAGIVAGIGTGFGARHVIADLRDLPAGPVFALFDPLLRLLLGVVAGSICAGLALFAGTRDARPQAAHASAPAGGRARSARQLLALGAWCAAVVVAADLDTAAEASILAGVVTIAALLLVPEFVDVVLRLLPERGPRTRLSRRQLAGDRQRAIAAVAVLTVAIAGSLGYLTLLTTVVRTLETKEYPPVLPGQVLVADRSGIVFPPPADVLNAVEASHLIESKSRLQLHYLQELDAAGNQTRAATISGTVEHLLAVDNVAAVEQLLTSELAPAQAAVLRRGGTLLWADAAARQAIREGRAPLAVTTGTTAATPVPIPAATVALRNVAWRVGTGGILLTQTARRLDLPLSTGATLYVGLTSQEARALQRAVARAGLDARTIQIYEGLPSVVPPAALVATAAGLAIAALLATFAAARGQARVLRGYLARLISIGLPVSWARQVLLYQQAVVLAAATILGAVIATVPLLVAEIRIGALVLSVPWTQVLVLVVSIYLAASLAAVHSSRALSARSDALEHV